MAIRQTGFLFLSLLVLAGWTTALRADDRHAGYYYPKPGTQETYEARADTLPEASRKVRIGFATGLANQLRARPHAQTLAVFAKGAEAEKLILVALQDGRIETIYRARAVFANLTAIARVMPLFSEFGVQEVFTFFDLAKMLGFTQITISDGDDFAHQVFIQ